MPDPDWLRQAKAEGRATETTVNLPSLGCCEVVAPKDKEKWAQATKGWSEAKFQEMTVALAHQHGWKVVHIRRVRVQRKDGTIYYETPFGYDGKGFPDLLLVRERVIFVELKAGSNKPSEEQVAWHEAVRSAGSECYCWWPRDWAEIEGVLTRRMS